MAEPSTNFLVTFVERLSIIYIRIIFVYLFNELSEFYKKIITIRKKLQFWLRNLPVSKFPLNTATGLLATIRVPVKSFLPISRS